MNISKRSIWYRLLFDRGDNRVIETKGMCFAGCRRENYHIISQLVTYRHLESDKSPNTNNHTNSIMTKVNNGRITSSGSSRAKANAVLARLDELSSHLADDIDAASVRHENDTTNNNTNHTSNSNKNKNDNSSSASSSSRAKQRVNSDLKQLETMAEGKAKEVYTTSPVESIGDESSTVIEEISYGLLRWQREGSMKEEEKVIRKAVDEKKVETHTESSIAISATSDAFTPLLPSLAERDQRYSSSHPMNYSHDDNDDDDEESDDSSSLGGFSIEEVRDVDMATPHQQEDETIAKTTAEIPIMVAPLIRTPSPPAPQQVKQQQHQGEATDSPEEKNAPCHSVIDRYVHDLNVDDGLLDDASVLEMQMSRTPKIRNRKRDVLVGKAESVDGVAVGGGGGGLDSNVGGGLDSNNSGGGGFFDDAAGTNPAESQSEKSIMTASKSTADVGTNSVDGKSANTAASTRKTKSGGLFQKISASKQPEETTFEDYPPLKGTSDTTSRGSFAGLFSRAAPKPTKKQSKVAFDECSEVSRFNPPSHLSIDIESADSSRRHKKRSTSPSSLGDASDDILRAAIVLKDDKIKRRRRGAFCGLFLVSIAAVSTVTALVHTNNVPTFLRGPLNRLGISPSSPTTSEESRDESDGEIDVTAVWYADFDQYKCVQQCEEGADSVACGGTMEEWEQGFDTVEECCLENFSSFIGKDWSLRDCIAVSVPVSSEGGTGGPTYMPTSDGEVVEEMETAQVPAYPSKDDDDDADSLPQSGTTPWATGGYVLELDENFNPINPTTALPAITTELPEVSKLTRHLLVIF